MVTATVSMVLAHWLFSCSDFHKRSEVIILVIKIESRYCSSREEMITAEMEQKCDFQKEHSRQVSICCIVNDTEIIGVTVATRQILSGVGVCH